MNGHRWPSLGDRDSTGHFRTKVFLAVNNRVTVKCVNHMKADIRENTTPFLIRPSGHGFPILTITGITGWSGTSGTGSSSSDTSWQGTCWHTACYSVIHHRGFPKGFMLGPTCDLTNIFYLFTSSIPLSSKHNNNNQKTVYFRRRKKMFKLWFVASHHPLGPALTHSRVPTESLETTELAETFILKENDIAFQYT